MPTPLPTMRIGELATRTGVSVHVLRVWERRYGLLTPGRSAGGYRLYGPQDEWRVRETARLREEGMPAAQAAATALHASRELPPELEHLISPTNSTSPSETERDGAGDGLHDAGVSRLRERLLQAIGEFDGTAAQAILDVALEHLGVEGAIAHLVMPVLHETGNRWAAGRFTVAQEHFASNLIRIRLSSLSLTWDAGTGPIAVLACPSGERHDLALLAFGVVLGRTGWRVRYLGADTPLATLGSAVEALEPDLVVLSAVREQPLAEAADHLAELPETAAALGRAQVIVAGPGATPEVAARLGATRLEGDPVEVARRLAERRRQA
ncbi:MerR family transcriptional regulator [Ornithinimicrobium pratense]|uniref:Cobalamin B12-binding domain-containing protein n=1 Tax=Ornithinimicrobium pratense TaxID=2593973 RepID=A0A5J6V148_9MICO|nr:MerR family transcriptional regulator [Ornithinimicrobium pratense]QFG67399.1 cobalamin B12-binding domain-containing protein [Ornithinimicrobium pratense]